MPILFDHDPVTGITQHFDYDPISDKIHIHHTQSGVAQMLDQIAEKRRDAKTKGKVEEFAHYATIPPIVEMELRKKGLDLLDRNATKRIIQEIETNYPWVKVTDKKHG